MASQKPSSGLLSLGDEILVEILRPLLQHNIAVAKRSDSYVVSTLDEFFAKEFPGPFHLDMFAQDSDKLSIQVLRVCKRLNAIGTPLLYENTLILNIPPPDLYYDSGEDSQLKAVQALMQKFANAKQSPGDDGDGLLERAVLFVHTDPRDRPRDSTIEAGAGIIQEYTRTLAKYRKCWEKVAVLLIDMTVSNLYGFKKRTGLMLLQHFGIMHTKQAIVANVVEGTANEIEWCMKQPDCVVPRPLEAEHLAQQP